MAWEWSQLSLTSDQLLSLLCSSLLFSVKGNDNTAYVTGSLEDKVELCMSVSRNNAGAGGKWAGQLAAQSL